MEESQVCGNSVTETQKRNRASDIGTDLCGHDGQLTNNCPAVPSDKECARFNCCKALTDDALIDGALSNFRVIKNSFRSTETPNNCQS